MLFCLYRKMNKNNAKHKRNNFQKPSDGDTKKFNKSKPKSTFEKVKSQNSKIIFDDEGNQQKPIKKKNARKSHSFGSNNQTDDIASRWYQEFAEYNTNDEVLDMKENEVTELANTCKTSFENELIKLQKKNPTDSKWLEIALHKGTSKDRANAGALLVQTNPLGHLTSLEKLIGLTKISNKTSTEAVGIITELFISALLSPNRKLLSIPLRGADWKALKKNNNIEKNVKDRVFAAWHFEAELKEQYYEFLRNLQAAIQGSQDSNKNIAIVCTAKLLCYSPEKEQMLLSMLVNKLGDPSNLVASKALHHLTEVAYKHPAMCEVIAKETEKLLFRNNITEHAQHFALCFLAQIAPRGNTQLCTKLVEICFSFFKVMVQKGAVNSKTMHAILRCLKRAIVDACPDGSDAGSILTKDIQDTMYRLIHLADVHVALQTFALLLQIMTVKSGKYDRFYNALYKKMLDINLVNVGPKAAAQFLHIIHRSTYMDANVARGQAFIKRLLQMAMYFPVQIACGCIIVVDKLLKSRPELAKTVEKTADNNGEAKWSSIEDESDGEEHYKDAVEDEENEDSEKAPESLENGKFVPSWHHAKNVSETKTEKVSQIIPTRYNPYQRTPAFAGAEFILKTELLRLAESFHPSLKVFSKSLIDEKPINFYGDPLRDFCLTQFLDRFAFRNPKKPTENVKSQSMAQLVHHKNYKASGSRGLPVKELTKSNCTEDEMFILEYLQQKREKQAVFAKNESDEDDADSVNDDEFDAYLDGLGGKEDDLDFMNDLGDELNEDKVDKKKKNKKKVDDEDKAEENEGDWDEDLDDDGEDNIDNKKNTIGDEQDSDDGSISLGDDSDDDASVFDGDEDDDDDIFEESDPEDEPKSKKMKGMSGKDFQKILKNTDNMNSLFAAAEDFGEMLQETGSSKTHGTLGDIFNKDKASEKQLSWEQKRFKSHDYSSKKNNNRKFGNKKPGNKPRNKKKF